VGSSWEIVVAKGLDLEKILSAAMDVMPRCQLRGDLILHAWFAPNHPAYSWVLQLTKNLNQQSELRQPLAEVPQPQTPTWALAQSVSRFTDWPVGFSWYSDGVCGSGWVTYTAGDLTYWDIQSWAGSLRRESSKPDLAVAPHYGEPLIAGARNLGFESVDFADELFDLVYAKGVGRSFFLAERSKPLVAPRELSEPSVKE